MDFISTRGGAPRANFAEVLLAGLAPDGGLYMPVEWPHIADGDIAAFAGARYQDVAFEILRRFTGQAFSAADLRADIEAAYAGFDAPAIAPLSELGKDTWLLELFHGPTFAFKDIAMQVLARLMDLELRAKGLHITIVGATSGDTGSAAIEAFKGRHSVDIFILRSPCRA